MSHYTASSSPTAAQRIHKLVHALGIKEGSQLASKSVTSQVPRIDLEGGKSGDPQFFESESEP